LAYLVGIPSAILLFGCGCPLTHSVHDHAA
jgi:hypothetical protein